MGVLRRAVQVGLLLSLSNLPLLFQLLSPGGPAPILLAAALILWYLWFNLSPWRGRRDLPRRLRAMMGGRELLLTVGWCVLVQGVCLFCFLLPARPPLPVLLARLGLVLLVLVLPALNGFVRIVATSTRLRLVLRLLLLLFWWLPIVNLVLIARACALVRGEYRFELAKLERNEARAENQVCQTRYPIVLVHGIFFRDWQLVNYWGRIPRELLRNGAALYYGGQQSAAPVAVSAAELRDKVLSIVEETGCGKVNLIAHSKGGLDSRYAISHLGLAPYVASLTTINTPHRGCVFAETLLRRLPGPLIHWVEHKYNGLFEKLGDRSPDFLGGVTDLTASRCAVFNDSTPDMPGILYQSVMSTMGGARSAPPPLNMTYLLVKHFDSRENDGLVTLDSAPWGNFLGNLTVPGRRGLSHGDVIDLMREDIPGFDVCEFYVNLVRELKNHGL